MTQTVPAISVPATASTPLPVRSSTDSNARTALAFQALAASAGAPSTGGLLERRQLSQLNVAIAAPSPVASTIPGKENEASAPASAKAPSLKQRMLAKLGRLSGSS